MLRATAFMASSASGFSFFFPASGFWLLPSYFSPPPLPNLPSSRASPAASPPTNRSTSSGPAACSIRNPPTTSGRFKLNSANRDTASLFALAQKLDNFKTPLESGLKVANTGKKTFRYTDENGASTEKVFNYSTDVTAQQLLDRFEQIASSERALISISTGPSISINSA